MSLLIIISSKHYLPHRRCLPMRCSEAVVIRDPYVLEFLGLTPNDDFYESDLEQALITHLQKFLLELGKGFTYIGNQHVLEYTRKRSRVDMLFFHRGLLPCSY